MQLLNFLHQSLLSRLEAADSDAATRAVVLRYCASVVRHGAELLQEFGRAEWSASLDGVVQSSIVGVLLPTVLSLLLRISAPPSHPAHGPGSDQFFATAESLVQLVRGSGSSAERVTVGPLALLLQHAADFHQRRQQWLAQQSLPLASVPGATLNLPDMERAVQVLESQHPYASVDSLRASRSSAGSGSSAAAPFVPKRMAAKAFSFPGAEFIVLVFDPRCATNHRSDVLTLSALDGRRLVAGSPPCKSRLYPNALAVTPGAPLELSLNNFPRTPVVVHGDALMITWSPEGTIRERERGGGVSSHHSGAAGQADAALKLFGFKVSCSGVHLRSVDKTAVPTCAGESGVHSLPYTLALLNDVALVAGHCAQLCTFPPPQPSPSLVPPAAVLAAASASRVPASTITAVPTGAPQPSSSRADGGIRRLLQSDLFAGGLDVSSLPAEWTGISPPSAVRLQQADGSPTASPIDSPSSSSFLEAMLSGASPAAELIQLLHQRASGRPAMSAVARASIVQVERTMAAALLHCAGLMAVAHSVAEEVRDAVKDTRSDGHEPDSAALPPSSFTPGHPAFPQLLQVWSALYQAEAAFLARARAEKSHFDLLGMDAAELEAELRAMDHRQRGELHARLQSDVAEPALPSVSTATAPPASEIKLDALVKLVERSRALHLARQTRRGTAAPAATSAPATTGAEEKDAEHKDGGEEKEAVLEVSWEDAYAHVSQSFIARATLLLRLPPPDFGPATAPAAPIKSASEGLLITRSLCAADADGAAGAGEDESATPSAASSVSASPKQSASLPLTRSSTDVRQLHLADASAELQPLPLTRSNSLNRSTSHLQRRLLTTAVGSLPAGGPGRDVASTGLQAGTPSGSPAQDTSSALKRWQRWQKGSSTPPRGSRGNRDGSAAEPRLQQAVLFLSSAIEPAAVVREVTARQSEAQRRAAGLQVLDQCIRSLVAHSTAAASASASGSRAPALPAAATALNPLNGLLLGVGECIRARWHPAGSGATEGSAAASAPGGAGGSAHFLGGLEGVHPSLLGQVRASFARLLGAFSRLLTAPPSQVHASTKLLVLNCSALLYRSSDVQMLRDSRLLDAVHRLMAPVSSSSSSSAAESSARRHSASARSLAVCARHLFCQLAALVLSWTPTAEATSSGDLRALQQDVLTDLFDSIAAVMGARDSSAAVALQSRAEVASPAPASPAKPTATPTSNASSSHDDTLHSLLLLLHTLRHTAAVRRALSQPSSLHLMMRILQLNTALVADIPAATAIATSDNSLPASLRIQRLLLRVIRGMLTGSSELANRLLSTQRSSEPSAADSKQRAFISSLFDRVGELLSGSAMGQKAVDGSAASTAVSASVTVTASSSAPAEESQKPVSDPHASRPLAPASASPSPAASPPPPSSAPQSPSGAMFSLTIFNTESESVDGSQFAANLSASCRDVFKLMAASGQGAAASAGGAGAGVAAAASAGGSKGDWRTQLASGPSAVLMQGSLEECTRIGRLLSSRGYVCGLTAVPPSDALLRNSALADSNPSFFLSGRVALALAAEYIALLQACACSHLWQEAVGDELRRRAGALQTLASAAAGPALAPLASALAVLAVLGGLKEELRPGARVLVLPLDSDPSALLSGSGATAELESVDAVSATLLRVDAGRSMAAVAIDPVGDEAAPKTTQVAVSRLQPLPTAAQTALLLSAQSDVSAQLLDGVVAFLQRCLSPPPVSASATPPQVDGDLSLLQQELSLSALRFLAALMAHPRTAAPLLQRTGLVALLMDAAKRCPAASSGLHAAASHLLQLELQSTRMRMRWLDLRRPPLWRRAAQSASDADEKEKEKEAEEKKGQTGATSDESDSHSLQLPYQPAARQAKSDLPAGVAIEGAKYLLMEAPARSSGSGSPDSESATAAGPGSAPPSLSPVVHFTRDVQVHLPSDFLLHLGGSSRSSSGSLRRLEEQLRLTAASMGISGDADYCILADQPVDLTLPQYYFEVTLHSAHPISVGLTPKPASAAGAQVSDRDSAAAAAASRAQRHGQDPSAQLQQKLQGVLRSRMNLWAAQSVRLQSDGRAVRKVTDSAALVPGRDEVRSVTSAFGAAGDVIGCLWNLGDGAVSFTTNGKSLGVAFHVPLGGGSSSGSSSGGSHSGGGLSAKLFPAVSCTQPGTKFSFNFGASPFAYSLPAQSTVAESEESRADRLRRAAEAERLAAEAEEVANTRREVERVAEEMRRSELALQLIDMTGGLLPSKRAALMALRIHRWDAGAVANWVLENEAAAISEVNRRIREEDQIEAAEKARKAESERAEKAAVAARAAAEKDSQAGAASDSASSSSSSQLPSSGSVSPSISYDSQHSSSLFLSGAYNRPSLGDGGAEESDPALEQWLLDMEGVLIGARLERPELVQSLLRQLRAGGEERANALLSLPANVNVPPPPRKADRQTAARKPTQPMLRLADVRIGMRCEVFAAAQIKAAAVDASAAAASISAADSGNGGAGSASSSAPASSSVSSAWLSSMSHLHGRVVTIVEVDREHVETSELVRVRLEQSERSSVEEWWLPLSALRRVEDAAQEDAWIGMGDMAAIRSRAFVYDALLHMLCRRVLMAALSHSGDGIMRTFTQSASSAPVALMQLVAAERVPVIQLQLPSSVAPSTVVSELAAAGAVPTAASAAAAPTPPILDELLDRVLQSTPALLSTLLTASARQMVTGSTVVDTELAADRSLVGGDNSTAGVGAARQLHAGPDACGLVVTFSSQTRLPKRDDRIILSECIEGASAGATAASVSAANFVEAPARVLHSFHGGGGGGGSDKSDPPSPLHAFFYPLSADPRCRLTLQLRKDRATSTRTIRARLEAVPVPANQYGLGLWMANQIIARCAELQQAPQSDDKAEQSAAAATAADVSLWRGRLRAVIEAVGSFLLTPRLPPLIRISLFQLLIRCLYTLRSLSAPPHPEPVALPIESLFTEMTTLHRAAQANSRHAQSSSGSGGGGGSAHSSAYSVQPQYATVYLQTLVELVATWRRIFGEQRFKEQVVDAQAARRQTSSAGGTKGMLFTTPAIKRSASSSSGGSSTSSGGGSTPAMPLSFSFMSPVPSSSPSSSAAPPPTPAAASAAGSASVAAAAASSSRSPASAGAAPAVSAAATPASSPAAQSSAASSAAPSPPAAPSRPLAVARRQAPALQIEQLEAMGFSADAAEAALVQFGSLNAALDALMGGFVPTPSPQPPAHAAAPAAPEPQPQPLAEPQQPDAPAPEQAAAPAAAAPSASAPPASSPAAESAVPSVAASSEASASAAAAASAADAAAGPICAADDVPSEEEESASEAEEDEDEDDDEASLAAAIALSMAAAEEDAARDAAQADAQPADSDAPAPAPAPVDPTPADEQKSQGESKEEEANSEPAPAAASAAVSGSASALSSAIASPSASADSTAASDAPAPAPAPLPPLTAPVTTEAWFDSYCMGVALLDAMCTDGAKLRLPMGAANAALSGSVSSSSSGDRAAAVAAAAALLESESASGVFTAAHDEQLIALANQIENKHSLRLIAKLFDSTFVADLAALVGKADRSHLPLLRAGARPSASDDHDSSSSPSSAAPAIGDDALVRRLCLLVLLNSCVHGALPLCDLSLAGAVSDCAGGPGPSANGGGGSGGGGGLHSLAQHLSFFRVLLLSTLKVDFTHAVLDATCLHGEAASRQVKATVSVDRLLSAAHGDAAHSLFSQTYALLAHVPVAHLLGAKPAGNPHTAFSVTFKGEHVVGESGPYRELFADIVNELQADAQEATATAAAVAAGEAGDNVSASAPSASSSSSSSGHLLPYLVPSVNRRVQSGEGRDRWLLNPACSSDEDKQRLAFLGALMGLAVRTGILLPLSWPRLLWKQLLDLRPTRDDLEAVDAAFANGVLRPLEEGAADAEDQGPEAQAEAEARFRDHFGSELTWSTTLSDGSSVDLRPNGSELAVQFSERLEYARRAEWARLNEAREQTLVLKRGFLSTFPAPLLTLLTAGELERLVCGDPLIDVSLLRRHTHYAGCSESDEHVQWFWQCLSDMSQEERRAFLVFSWAQQRMPNSDAEFTTRAGHRIRMLVKSPPDGGKAGDADKRFMTSDTCFWNITLPRYSSLSVMRRMLLTVLSLSSGMDGDDVGAMEREEQDDFDELQRQEDERERGDEDEFGEEQEDEEEDELSQEEEEEDDDGEDSEAEGAEEADDFGQEEGEEEDEDGEHEYDEGEDELDDFAHHGGGDQLDEDGDGEAHAPLSLAPRAEDAW